VKKSFNIQELLHCKSKRHETKLMHPSSSRAFQRDQELDLKHPSSVDIKGTKQNKYKQTTFSEIYKKLNLLAMLARPKSQTKSLNYKLNGPNDPNSSL
jgi:hypothetical protein